MTRRLVDDIVFHAFKAHRLDSVLTHYAPDNAAEVAACLRAGEPHPAFTYSSVYTLDLSTRVKILKEFRDALPYLGDTSLEYLYLCEVDNLLATFKKLQAMAEGDDRRFYQMSLKGRGVMDRFSVEATRVRLAELINNTARKKHSTVREARQRLLDTVEVPKGTFTVLDLLKEQGVVLPEYIDVSSEEELNAAAVHRHFVQYLEDNELSGYRVEIDASGKEKNLKVRQKTKVVIIPNDNNLQVGRRRPITPTTVRAFAEHELGVHVARGVNGYTRLNLLGFGVDGYLNVEECIASVRQALVEGIDDLQKFEHRLVSMAIEGNLTGEQMTMAEAYVILRDALTLREALEGTGDVDLDRVHNLTWTPLLRVCRGTTGVNPGVCYTKDSRVYTNGFVEVYRLLQDKSWGDMVMRGKFDPRRPGHVRPLELLGVL